MIRKMKIDDLAQVLAIEKDNFLSPYSEVQYAYEIEDNPCAYLYVLEEDNHIVGYIDFWITFESVQLCKVAVDKKYQKQGYGRKMMEYMFEEVVQKDCETLFLEVRVSNKKAQQFYGKMDFLEVNRRKNYYDHPQEDAIVLGKILIGDKDE